MQLVTQPPPWLLVANTASGTADVSKAVVTKKASADDDGCYLPQYFQRHYSDITRNRIVTSSGQSLQRSYVDCPPLLWTLCAHR